MNFLSTIKALGRLGGGPFRRRVDWTDERYRSPKDLGDYSGVILSRVGGRTNAGIQDYNYDVIARIAICNDLAWTCINRVSSTAALAKLKVRIRTNDSIQYVPDHPLQKMLDFPNSSMTQFDLIQAYVTHQRLFGTVGILLLRDNMLETCPLCFNHGANCLHMLWTNNTGPITQMMPVHPSCIEQAVVEVNGEKKRQLVYIPEPGRRYPIHPNNILTDPFYNTESGWYGISPTFLLKKWLDLDQAMTQQMNKFFENGAIPSLIVNMKPGNNYTYEQEPDTLMKMMKEKWLAQFSSRSADQKTPAFVYGDINIQRLEEHINSTISKDIYYEIQGRVCATFGVPPGLYEVGMKYTARGAQAQVERDFYNYTISEILARFERKINKLVVPTFNTPGLEVVWDLSQMGIASFLIQAKKDAVKKDWELGLISRDDARVLLGYDPVGGELGNDFYRLTVMSDGKNGAQAAGMDNRLKVPPQDNENSSYATTTFDI